MSIIFDRLQKGGTNEPDNARDSAGGKPADAPDVSAKQTADSPFIARPKHDSLRHVTAEKRKLERELDRMRGTLEKQTARLKQLEREARTREPLPPTEALAQATELDHLRAKAASLQQDIYNSTQLVELAKLELDKQKKIEQTLRTSLENARAELDNAERSGRANEAERAESTETNRRLQEELAQLRQEQESAESAQRQQLHAFGERLAAAEATTRQRQWFLKLDDGTVLGPANEDECYAWACDCRLGPDHLVSRDGQAWLPARDVPALRMEWMVELVDGSRYGPLNIFAVQHLLGDGSVRPEARLENTHSGTVCRALDVSAPDILALREEHKRAVGELAAMRSALARAQARLAQLEQPAAPGAPPKLVRALVQKHRPTRT